ncbi:MAG: VOC family protein [Bacteroidetes bacterium]|nr:VOC family protein [Bacteroidota bacterium]
MLLLNQPILFLATADPIRSRSFYENVLCLAFVGDEPGALVFDVAGTQLRIQKVDELSEVRYTVLGWAVEDIREAMTELVERGVTFEQYEFLPQDEHGVWETPSGVKISWFTDPDGNTLSLTQV